MNHFRTVMGFAGRFAAFPAHLGRVRFAPSPGELGRAAREAAKLLGELLGVERNAVREIRFARNAIERAKAVENVRMVRDYRLGVLGAPQSVVERVSALQVALAQAKLRLGTPVHIPEGSEAIVKYGATGGSYEFKIELRRGVGDPAHTNPAWYISARMHHPPPLAPGEFESAGLGRHQTREEALRTLASETRKSRDAEILSGSPELMAQRARLEREELALEAAGLAERQASAAAQEAEASYREVLDRRFKLVKWKRGVLNIPYESGKSEPVLGVSFGGLIVTKSPTGEFYTVSHIASGKSLGGGLHTQSQAKLASWRISSELGIDWTRPEGVVLKQVVGDIQKNMRQILLDPYAQTIP